MRDRVITVSKVTEEAPLRELLLPRDATTRLCFFSLPLELLPFYRERVFPVVEEAGFVPVTADDVVTPGDTVSAKLDTLIDWAFVMVAEPTSSLTMAYVSHGDRAYQKHGARYRTAQTTAAYSRRD